MQVILEFFYDMVARLVGVLQRIQFTVFGVTVNWFHLLLSFVVICFIISVFWKGARK